MPNITLEEFANPVDPDEMAHINEPSHLDLRQCMFLFGFLNFQYNNFTEFFYYYLDIIFCLLFLGALINF